VKQRNRVIAPQPISLGSHSRAFHRKPHMSATKHTPAITHEIARAVALELAEMLDALRPFATLARLRLEAAKPPPRAPHPERPLPNGVTDEVARRFWDKVAIGAPDTCWRWKGTLSRYGYGIFNFEGRRVLAHRFAYTIAVGPIPKGMILLHGCDDRACANPDHLRPGTQTQNMADKVRRGRHLKGSQMANAKLDETKVAHIRSSTESNAALARRYCVSPGLISSIRLGHKWRTVSEKYLPPSREAWRGRAEGAGEDPST
jgi:hypothetical protein